MRFLVNLVLVNLPWLHSLARGPLDIKPVLNLCPMTDYGDKVLDNCAQNVHHNSGKFSASVYVRELDWKASWPLEKRAHSQRRSIICYTLILVPDSTLLDAFSLLSGYLSIILVYVGMIGPFKNLKIFKDLLYS